MKIRLGYACISQSLEENFKTYTYTRYQEEKNQEQMSLKEQTQLRGKFF